MSKRICRQFIWVACLLLAGSATGEKSSAVWPLDLPTRYLTSNFMEYRPGRFHAGLDFKTQSRMGFAVRAVEDGWISRVRSSPGAYGRAVYVRGVSGRTFVYAHLMRFNDELRGRVRARQYDTGTYRAQLTLGPRDIPVKAGDVLGLSGQSGTRGPHLHFEIRDADQRPLDPQTQGFALPDTFAPVIHTVRVWPASPTATVQGVAVEHVLPVDGRTSLPDLHVSGPVAFSARIVDQTDIRGHRLEPWRIEVQLDRATVYSCRNEKFDFTDNSQQRLEWTAGIQPSLGPGLREHWLHRRSGVDLPGRDGGLWYEGAAGAGLASGRHELIISATDRAGNRTSVAFGLVVGNESQGIAWLPESHGLRGPQYGSLVVTPFFKAGESAPLSLETRQLSSARGDPVLARTWLLSHSVDLDPWWDVLDGQQLVAVGPAAVFSAPDWPVDGSVSVTFPLLSAPVDPQPDAETASRVGVYRFDDEDGWSLVGPLDRSGEQPGFALDDLGLHAVLRDDVSPVFQSARAPLIVGPGVASVTAAVTMSRWRVFPLALDDTGSGVAAETISAVLDGQPLLVEPDLIRDRVLVELPDDLAPGPHELRLEAGDEAGNTGGQTYRILCTEESP